MASTMKTELKGKVLTLTINLDEPHASASGKTMILASTGGNIPLTVAYNGKPIILGLNAYYKP